jgi:hypothetical protein
MPAKAKSKKPQKKSVPKTPVVPKVENPPAPPTPPSAPAAAEVPKATDVESPPPPPPVATTETNLEEMFDSEPEDESHKKANVFLFTLGTVVAILLAVSGVSVFIIYMGSSKVPKVAAPQTSTAPTPTPTPYFSRMAITFEVLNASGVSGAAGKGATKLIDTGYTVVSTGNAKKQAQSELFLSSTLTSAVTTQLMGDMQSLFSITTSSGNLLDSKGVARSTASALLILGVK